MHNWCENRAPFAHRFVLDPREYCISTKDFVLDGEGQLEGLNTVRVEWTKDSGGRWKMEEVPGSEKFFPAQLVFLALGFLGPQLDVIKALGVKQDARSNIQTPFKVRLHHIIFADVTKAFTEIFHQRRRCLRRW